MLYATGFVLVIALTVAGLRRRGRAGARSLPSVGVVVAATSILVGSLPALPALASHVTEPVTVSLPSARDETSAVWAGNAAYVFGGRGSTTNSNQIVKFDPAANTVTTPAVLPSARRCTAAAYDPVSQAAYIFGGSDNSGSNLTSVVKFIPSSGSVSTISAGGLTNGRNCGAAVWAGSFGYVFGGCCDSTGSYHQTVEQVSTSGSVTHLTPTGTAGALAKVAQAAVYAGANKVYLFGGESNAGLPSSQIVEYDIGTNVATVLSATLPTAREFASAMWDATSGSAYVFGGFNNYANEIVKFTPSTGSVTTIANPFPSARAFMSVAYSGSVAYLFGGDISGVGMTSEILRYAPNNRAPTAVISTNSPVECVSPSSTPVSLVGTSSSDPDGDPLTYDWSASGGTVTNPTQATASGDFPIGTTSVTLTVADDWDHEGSASATVTVRDTTPPTTSATTSPAGQDGWYPGPSVAVTLAASDACSSTTTFQSLDGAPYTAGTSVTVTGGGTHTLNYYSQDSRGNTEAVRTLVVKIDVGQPQVSLDTPEPGSLYILDVKEAVPSPVTTVVGGITLKASASDAESGVARVEFYDGTTLIGTDTTAPYQVFWPNTGLVLGLHTLTVKAFDKANNSDTQSRQVLAVPLP